MTYYASEKRVAEREANLEPLDLRQVARHAAQQRGRHAHAGEIERAHGDAPPRDAHEMLLRRELAAADEAKRLHGAPGEQRRGGGWVPTEGAEVGQVCWCEMQGAPVVA